MLSKAVSWLVVAGVVFAVVTSPDASARVVHSAGSVVGAAATSVVAFVRLLV